MLRMVMGEYFSDVAYVPTLGVMEIVDDDKPSEARHQDGSTTEDVEARATTIAVALAAAAERIVPIAGSGMPLVQPSPRQEEAQASTEAVATVQRTID
jgi:hypothetical protein